MTEAELKILELRGRISDAIGSACQAAFEELKRRADVSRQDWEEIPHPDGASDGAAFIVSTGDEPVFCVSVDGKWYRFRMPPIPGALRITLENGTVIETTGYVSDNSPGKSQP